MNNNTIELNMNEITVAEAQLKFVEVDIEAMWK